MSDHKIPLWRIVIDRWKTGEKQEVEIGGRDEAIAAAKAVLDREGDAVFVVAYRPAYYVPMKRRTRHGTPYKRLVEIEVLRFGRGFDGAS